MKAHIGQLITISCTCFSTTNWSLLKDLKLNQYLSITGKTNRFLLSIQIIPAFSYSIISFYFHFKPLIFYTHFNTVSFYFDFWLLPCLRSPSINTNLFLCQPSEECIPLMSGNQYVSIINQAYPSTVFFFFPPLASAE